MTYDMYARTRRALRRRVAAGLAVAAVATAAVVTGLVFATDSSPTADPASPQSITAAPAPSITAAAAGGVQLPTDLRWTDVGGVWLPVSEQAGPRDTTQGLARGFAHDPAGAVLAAVHILVRITPQVGPHVFDPTVTGQVVGPDAAALREQVAQQYETLRGRAQVAYGQPVGSPQATLGGYRLLHYDEQTAWLDLLTVATTRQVLISSRVQMTWTGSDWALVAPPGGTFDGSVSVVSAADAAHYHRFPGR